MDIQQLFCLVLLPGYVKNCIQHSYVSPFQIFLLRIFLDCRKCNYTAVLKQLYRADMSFRDVTIENPDKKYDHGMWMTSCTGSVRRGFWGFEEKSAIWVLPSEGEGWLSLARRGLAAGVARGSWADGKVSIERWYPSPYVEELFNSKVIKSFVPELRSRKCFCLSGFLCIDIMNVLRTGMNMYISRIHVWLCYTLDDAAVIRFK